MCILPPAADNFAVNAVTGADLGHPFSFGLVKTQDPRGYDDLARFIWVDKISASAVNPPLYRVPQTCSKFQGNVSFGHAEGGRRPADLGCFTAAFAFPFFFCSKAYLLSRARPRTQMFFGKSSGLAQVIARNCRLRAALEGELSRGKEASDASGVESA